MTTLSPALTESALVTFTIEVDGKEIDQDIQVLSIDTRTGVNKVPRARLVFSDGSPAQSNFELSDLQTFVPGKKVRIAAGYDGKESPIFEGVIVKQGIRINQSSGSKLVVEVTDPAIRMTLERRSAVFESIKDSELIAKLITQNGLGKEVAATHTVHEAIVQYYTSDWDLMVTRAEMNGFVVVVEAGKVTVGKPDTKQAPELGVKYGDSILELSAEMDAATQFASSAIKSYTWDMASQGLVGAPPGPVEVEEPGNISSVELAKVFDVKELSQKSGGLLKKSSLQDWSSGELLKSKLSKICGSVCFQGNAAARTGKMLELAGCGDRFNGAVFVSGVDHGIRDGRWTTTAGFGLAASWFAATAPHIAAADASGQLPPIKGLQTGVVKKVSSDPEGEFRVLVSLPILQESSLGVWARLSTFYASNKVGAVFYPEVGDEVVVGFMNQDPRYPVILGAVYSKTLPPPYSPDEKNGIKALVTRGKLEIEFDEENKILQLRTPGKHLIKMNDQAAEISIEDSNGNSLVLSKAGVALSSASNLKIEARGNITVGAGGSLELSAEANASMQGLQVAHTAKTKFSAKGSASSEVTSSGILTLRGSLVKIN